MSSAGRWGEERAAEIVRRFVDSVKVVSDVGLFLEADGQV